MTTITLTQTFTATEGTTEGAEPAERLPDGVERLAPHLTGTKATAGLYPVFGGWERYTVVLYGLKSFNFTYERASVAEDFQHQWYLEGGIPAHLMAVPEGVCASTFLRNEFQTPLEDNPWFKLEWFASNWLRWVEHLPRPSETVPGLLSYFQTPEKRARNIRTPIKPGKYLQKFFGDLLSQEEIHAHALAWQNHFALREVKITQDADEIERVYRGRHNGSCMHFGEGGFAGSCHPARAYAGPDLGIAYIGDIAAADARCLVWPAKKMFYAKWYGDGNRLQAALEAVGYKAGSAHEFYGARFRRIEHKSGFVVPYVDVCDYADDDGEHLILGRGDVYLRNTSGSSMKPVECYACDDDVDEDDTELDYRGRHICSSCQSNYFTCEITDELYPDRMMASTPDEYMVSEPGVANSNDWFFCDTTDMHYPRSAYEEVTLVGGDTCVRTHAEKHGFYCEFAEAWSLNRGTRVLLSDGRTVSTECFVGRGDFDLWMEDEGVTEVGTIVQPDQLDMRLAA